jgi:2-polyprenyl-3-methyl-5-hydroxy-6-metoxy-1,4-benzoquinol methylase
VEGTTYAQAFGFQWRQFARTQLDSHSGLSLSRDRAARAFGEEWNHLSGLSVLEAGCGAGRFTEVLLGQGAQVMSLDMTDAVDVNGANFPITSGHRVVQANLLELPFEPGQFDVVFCLGVLQHLPSPEQGIRALCEQLRGGGLLVIDHYRLRLGWYLRTAPAVREVLRRLPPAKSAAIVDRLVQIVLPFHRRAQRHRVLQSLLSRVSPVVSYYGVLPGLTESQQREWARLDTFDSLTDWFKHFRTAASIRRTLRDLGLVDIESYAEGGVVVARARRNS